MALPGMLKQPGLADRSGRLRERPAFGMATCVSRFAIRDIAETEMQAPHEGLANTAVPG